MALEVYRNQGGKRLRCGYTTGTCAALAAQAAARALLLGEHPGQAALVTPKGIEVKAPVLHLCCEGGQASCAVQKDAGDDTDVTDGMEVCAAVRRIPHGIVVEGGEGVGRVTKPGLDQPVGAAAINRVPRRMIAQQLENVLEEADETGGLECVVSIPRGKELAGKTFNPNLGIVGGLSVLGTSGIVEPQSLQALLDSIALEVRMHAAEGHRSLLVTPGNYGEDFLARYPRAVGWPLVKCANFVGDTIDLCVEHHYRQVLLVGHIGKFIKLAGGVMNTHSRTADCRAEIFAAHTAIHGGGQQVARAIMEAATTDECIAILERAGLRQAVFSTLLPRIQHHLDRRAAGALRVGAVLFSNTYGLLGETEGARRILDIGG